MRIRIGDTEYPGVGHNSANLLHLMELQQQSRKLWPDQPLGMGKLDELEHLARDLSAQIKAAKAAGDAAAQVAAERALMDQGMVYTAVAIFLSRRAAGDRVTFTQAIDIDMSQVEFVEDDDDPAVEDDHEDVSAVDPTTGPGSTATPVDGPAPLADQV